MYNQNDDLKECMDANSGDLENFKEEDILDIIAEVCGANEEYAWWWVLKLEEGFVLLAGDCDYTGWDCQSGITYESKIFNSAVKAAKDSPEKEENTGRKIRANLIAQLEDRQPFGLYQENIDEKKDEAEIESQHTQICMHNIAYWWVDGKDRKLSEEDEKHIRELISDPNGGCNQGELCQSDGENSVYGWWKIIKD